MIQECTRDCLCVDCTNDNCWHHGDKVADCPRWGECSLKREGTVKDCDECYWIDSYIERMRRMTIDLPWKIGDKAWYVGISAVGVPYIAHVEIQECSIVKDRTRVVVEKPGTVRTILLLDERTPLYKSKGDAEKALKNFKEESGRTL